MISYTLYYRRCVQQNNTLFRALEKRITRMVKTGLMDNSVNAFPNGQRPVEERWWR